MSRRLPPRLIEALTTNTVALAPMVIWRGLSETDLAHDEAGQKANHEHHQRPHAWRVEHGFALVDGAHHVTCDLLRLAGEGWRLEPCGHGRLDETGFDAENAQAGVVVLVVECLQVHAEAGLG